MEQRKYKDLESDFISKFFKQGFLHVLEKIFLELDPDTKAACSRVSPTWKNIIELFFKSSNPRYQKCIRQKLSKVWAQNTPECRTIAPAYLGSKNVRPNDVVLDDYNVVVSVLVKEEDSDDVPHSIAGATLTRAVTRFFNKIIILDSSNFMIIRDFYVDKMLGTENIPSLSTSLQLTEEHLLVNVKTCQGLIAHLILYREENFKCKIVHKDIGFSTATDRDILGIKKISRPVAGKNFVKFPIRDHNYENCTIAFYRTLLTGEASTELSHTKLNTTLPYVDTVAVPASKDFLVREFNYKNDYLSKLGYYNEDGMLIWEVVKPRFYSKIIAVDVDQAAVWMQSVCDTNGDRVDQIHLFNLNDGSLSSVMSVAFTEVIGKGQLDNGRLAMRVMTVCSQDVVVVDLQERKVVFSVKDNFGIDGRGCIVCLRQNRLIVVVENNIYSVKF